MAEVWRTAYEVLGEEKDYEIFDKEFRQEIDKQISTMKGQSGKNWEEELDSDINLEEVLEIIKELKDGKAAGTDGIVGVFC